MFSELLNGDFKSFLVDIMSSSEADAWVFFFYLLFLLKQSNPPGKTDKTFKGVSSGKYVCYASTHNSLCWLNIGKQSVITLKFHKKCCKLMIGHKNFKIVSFKDIFN